MKIRSDAYSEYEDENICEECGACAEDGHIYCRECLDAMRHCELVNYHMKTYYDVLKSLNACDEACEARKNITVEEAMRITERADWIVWLAQRLGVDKRKIILAKVRSSVVIKHLLKDERSLKALEVAEHYGLGNATDEELKLACDLACDVYRISRETVDDVYASYIAFDACHTTGCFAVRKENQKQVARICVEILGEDIISAVNKLINEGNHEN
jgi:hypothetical protein